MAQSPVLTLISVAACWGWGGGGVVKAAEEAQLLEDEISRRKITAR